MQRPPGVYIGPFISPPPIEKVTDHNEDHNWRRKEGKQYRGEVAISEGNWPEPRAERKHDKYINKQHRHKESVATKPQREWTTENLATWTTTQDVGSRLSTYPNGSRYGTYQMKNTLDHIKDPVRSKPRGD